MYIRFCNVKTKLEPIMVQYATYTNMKLKLKTSSDTGNGLLSEAGEILCPTD